MSIYVVSVLDKQDPETYMEYSRRARVALAEVGGEIVVSSDAPAFLEGGEGANRLVILRFNDEEALDRWWNSAEYQAAIPFRHKSAKTFFVAKVPGFEG